MVPRNARDGGPQTSDTKHGRTLRTIHGRREPALAKLTRCARAASRKPSSKPRHLIRRSRSSTRRSAVRQHTRCALVPHQRGGRKLGAASWRHDYRARSATWPATGLWGRGATHGLRSELLAFSERRLEFTVHHGPGRQDLARRRRVGRRRSSRPVAQAGATASLGATARPAVRVIRLPYQTSQADRARFGHPRTN